ncbi:restriction endonuclease subunit S [Pseudomonas mandelii]|uniref:Restriction endonuclease subunit S n=1 Tax=Pseudomonas mandelii TaxID=75612 RepID=A0AB36CX02_9PSED|nr:restriction endonuclease subunit S [Pseudomonas mandelii]NMZ80682.1 restriction endonuclease subunit S [Pseudomonas mandelii]
MHNQLSMPSRYQSIVSTGSEWVKDVPLHWHSLPLCVLAKIKSIVNCKNENLLSVYLELGVIKFEDVDAKRTNATSVDLSGYQLVEPGDFVMNNQQAWRGSVGVSKFRGIVSPAYLVLDLDERLDCRFANYLFRDCSMVGQYLISSKGVGTIQRNLYWAHLKRATVYLPPMLEQAVIANFLDARTTQIDQAIRLKERQIELLKERKQILIQQAVIRGLDPGASMRNSGVEWIGEIPAHWEVVRLKFLFEEINERTKTGEETLLSLRMEKGLVPHDDVSDKEITNENLVDYKLVRPGQMVMNRMRAAIGIFGVSSRFGLVSPDYAVFDIKERAASNFFLRLFKSPLLGTQFRLNSKGLGTGASGFMRLYTESFGNIKVALPPLSEQLEIHRFIDSASDRLDNACTLFEQQILRLKEYKSTLINSAVTGKIKVPGVVEPERQDMEMA